MKQFSELMQDDQSVFEIGEEVSIKGRTAKGVVDSIIYTIHKDHSEIEYEIKFEPYHPVYNEYEVFNESDVE